MSKTKHTPGPWFFWQNKRPEEVDVIAVHPSESTGNGWFAKNISITSKSGIVGEAVAMTTKYYLNSLEEFNANAHLIAAAPELLEVLELAVGFIKNEGVKSIAEAAINKANGNRVLETGE